MESSYGILRLCREKGRASAERRSAIGCARPFPRGARRAATARCPEEIRELLLHSVQSVSRSLPLSGGHADTGSA